MTTKEINWEEDFNDKIKEGIIFPDGVKQFIKELLSKERQKVINEILNSIPLEESHCELCDYPVPECSCRGYNQKTREIKEFINN